MTKVKKMPTQREKIIALYQDVVQGKTTLTKIADDLLVSRSYVSQVLVSAGLYVSKAKKQEKEKQEKEKQGPNKVKQEDYKNIIIGQKVGLWTILEMSPDLFNCYCRCEGCGKISQVTVKNLKTGRSLGCLKCRKMAKHQTLSGQLKLEIEGRKPSIKKPLN